MLLPVTTIEAGVPIGLPFSSTKGLLSLGKSTSKVVTFWALPGAVSNAVKTNGELALTARTPWPSSCQLPPGACSENPYPMARIGRVELFGKERVVDEKATSRE